MPPGWDGWAEALDEAYMAERYGWTPEQIDTVDKSRIHFWWAVQDVHRMASRYLRDVQGGFENTLQGLDR